MSDFLSINFDEDLESYSFPTKNIFVKAACHIARGGLPSVIGNNIESFNKFVNEAKDLSKK